MLLLPLARRRPNAAAAVAVAWLVGRSILGRLREQDLRGHVALVTGGSRGLGLLLARELAREGCRVAICARDVDELNDAWRSLQADGVEALAIPGDVGDRADAERIVAEVEAQLGPVDVLVNNASIMEVGPLPTLTADDFHGAMQANFWGTVYPTLAVVPAMRLRGQGRIVNVTSIGGRISAPHLLPYGAAKFATTGFSEGLHAELARDGVTVTTIVPWFMRTGSYLRAEFKPPRRAEFTWFSLGSSLPILSVDAERAAREIVAAARRRDTERSIGWLSSLAWRVHGLFPGITTTLLGVANRFLPRAPVAVGPGLPTVAAVPGEVVEGETESAALTAATTLGREAATRLNERTDSFPG
jgi:NAD(P)-dependent dehydrogenase (short-subunit alcohol dehydrogenase family)